MCHACIVESVKSNMLSRRSLFSGATAGADLLYALPSDKLAG